MSSFLRFLSIFLFAFTAHFHLHAKALPIADNSSTECLVPDLAITFNILSTIMDGPTFEFGIIDVYEVADDITSGTITVTLPKDPRFSFVYDSSLGNVGPYLVNNASWTYDNSDPDLHIWTTEDSLNALGKSSIGFIFNYDTEGDGEIVYTVSVVSGSGGEVNDSNNVDVEQITYFTK